ncbi:MAG: hypothetical protein ACPGVU_14630 [Limisphaerales bacterium]
MHSGIAIHNVTLLAYIDLRPLLFIVGLPVFVGFSLLVCRAAKAKKLSVMLLSGVWFTILFTVFLTGIGPFIGQKETREFMMTWEIKPSSPGEWKESEVVLKFVDFPDHFIGEHSDQLAAHLRDQGERVVKVVFEITSDYGTVRGYHGTEIAGLRDWKSEWGYGGTRGEASHSPWDANAQ